MSDKLEALKAKKPLNTKTREAEAAGYVTDDNSGGYYVVECQECGAVYPSQQSGGGGQIADTGDYDDSYCPHCEYVDPDECDNVGLVWNVQQAKINALLAALEEKGQEVNQLKSDYQKLAQEHRFLANESARKGVRNAELEQRLQQPIKLRKCDIGIACDFLSEHVVVSLAAVMVEAATAGFKAEVEGE